MPKRLLILFLLLLPARLGATVYNVTDRSTLDTAVGAVVGGDTINMADGNYTYASAALVISRSGTSGAHILMQATNYRAATITFTVSGNNLYRHNGNFWDLKNFVVDGNSARPSSEGLLTLGNTNGSPVVHDVTIAGVRLRKSGAAGFMIDEGCHDITITDMHIDGSGYVSIHGENIYIGSVGGVAVYNITFTDCLFEDGTENTIDFHPNVHDISLTRILTRGQTKAINHGVGATENARDGIDVSSGVYNATFTDVTMQGSDMGQDIFSCGAGSSTGSVTFTRLIVQTATLSSQAIEPDACNLTVDQSEFYNISFTNVLASNSGAGGTQAFTNTCGLNVSGSGDTTSCAAPTTPKFWQRQEQVTGSGTTAAKAFTLDNSAASVLTCEAVTGADVNATSSVTDTKGNTWARGYHSGGKLNVYYSQNIAAGPNTVTFNTGGPTTSIRMVIKEYKGTDANTVLASSSVASGTTGTVNSGNVTTGQNNNLLVQSCGADTPVTLTKDSNFTLRFFNGGDTLLTADRVPTAGTYSSTCTQSGSATLRSGILNFGPPTATGTIVVGNVVDLDDGAAFTLGWSSQQLSGGQNVDIFLSRNSGASYENVSLNEVDDGSYSYTASGASSSSCQWKVCGHTSTSVCGISATFRKKGKWQ